MARTKKEVAAKEPKKAAKEPEKASKKQKTVVKEKSIRKKTKKRNYTSYSVFIYKVLQQTHPGLEISSKAMGIMNSFVIDMKERFSKEAMKLVAYRKSKTLTELDIRTACQLILPGELKTMALNEGAKAIKTYNASKEVQE